MNLSQQAQAFGLKISYMIDIIFYNKDLFLN